MFRTRSARITEERAPRFCPHARLRITRSSSCSGAMRPALRPQGGVGAQWGREGWREEATEQAVLGLQAMDHTHRPCR